MADQHVVPGGPPYSQPDVQWRPEFPVWWVKASKLFAWAAARVYKVAEQQLLSVITICRSHPEDAKASLVHGLDETGCDVWNSVLIGDLLPSSMFTFLDAGIFTFLLADVFSCSKARKCTIQVALWLAKLVKVICIYTHEWIHLIAY